MSSVIIAGNTSGTVSLTAPDVAGTTVLTLPATSGTVITGAAGVTAVANGGTGASTLSANAVLLGNDTSAVQTVAPGTSGNVLTSNGTTWTSAALPAGGVTSLNGQTGAITNTDYGAIGSYVIAAIDTFGVNEKLPDVTVAGSTLIRQTGTTTAGINILSGTTVNNTNYVSLGFSGTWRRMTRSYSGNINNSSGDLYVRIS